MTRAIIYIPAGEFDPHAARCVNYAEERGYELVGIVRDNWPAARKMAEDGGTTVVIVSEESHLDPERKPRIEVVANEYSNGSRWERRTRVIRRVWGG
jgi:hypothetical protein